MLEGCAVQAGKNSGNSAMSMREADQACRIAAREYGGGATVVASFETTVGAMRGLRPLHGDPELWPRIDASRLGTLCYIDGIIGITRPISPASAAPPVDRGAVGIVGGDIELIAAGPRTTFPIRRP
jgi:hypothetical protein